MPLSQSELQLNQEEPWGNQQQHNREKSDPLTRLKIMLQKVYPCTSRLDCLKEKYGLTAGYKKKYVHMYTYDPMMTLKLKIKFNINTIKQATITWFGRVLNFSLVQRASKYNCVSSFQKINSTVTIIVSYRLTKKRIQIYRHSWNQTTLFCFILFGCHLDEQSYYIRNEIYMNWINSK